MGIQQSKLPTTIFPDVPRETPLVDKNGRMHDLWQQYFDQLTLTLQTIFRNEGFSIPQLPSASIALLTGEQSVGSIIYNTDSTPEPSFQGNIAGTWKTFTLT